MKRHAHDTRPCLFLLRSLVSFAVAAIWRKGHENFPQIESCIYAIMDHLADKKDGALMKNDESFQQGASQRFEIPLLVSKRDAAALLGICLRSVDNYIAAKELPCRRLGKRVLIPYTALVAFSRRDHLPTTATEPEGRT
jgi:hypothetical protein